MDLITIKFIGLLLMFHTTASNGRPVYTMFAADGTPSKKVCKFQIAEHHAYLRVIGTPISVSWPSAAIPCTLESTVTHSGDCNLYELDHDDLTISGVSNTSEVEGVQEMPSLVVVPRLKKYFGNAQLDAGHAHDKAAATLHILTGTLEGVPELNDMRDLRLTVEQPQIALKEVEIKSARADGRIVVNPGSEIAIINMMPDAAAAEPGNHLGQGEEEDWFLHFTLLEKLPADGDCHHPVSPDEFRKQLSTNAHLFVTLNKACSPTEFP